MRTAKPVLLALALLLALLAAVPAAQAAAPKRIVALTPFSANTLAGLGVRPVAIGETPGDNERRASNLRGVKQLTLSHPNGPNMEQLALLNPQLVLSASTWNKGANTMRDLGIRVVNAEPVNVAGTVAQTRAIGKVVKRESSANQLAARLQQQIAAARKGIRKRPRTLVVLGVGRTPFVMLRNSWGGDIVSKAGARLVTGGVSNSSGFARISDETILKENPDVIIAIPHANSKDIRAVAKHLRGNPAWSDSKAVRNNRLYVSTDNSLLQPNTNVADVIRKVRRSYLKN